MQAAPGAAARLRSRSASAAADHSGMRMAGAAAAPSGLARCVKPRTAMRRSRAVRRWRIGSRRSLGAVLSNGVHTLFAAVRLCLCLCRELPCGNALQIRSLAVVGLTQKRQKAVIAGTTSAKPLFKWPSTQPVDPCKSWQAPCSPYDEGGLCCSSDARVPHLVVCVRG